MRLAIAALLALGVAAQAQAQADLPQSSVLAPVLEFYKAFNEGFSRPADFATEDWNHVNPGGGWTRGRAAVLAEVRSVHQTFLKDVSEKVVLTDVRSAGRDAAVVTVVSVMSPYAPPGQPRVEAERHIRTFAVVRKGRVWKVMQDQNTTISAPPPGPDPR